MSKRNGMVTRWATDTFYKVEFFRAEDREIHTIECVAHGKRTISQLRAMVLKTLKKDAEVLVRLQITGYDKRLYGMPELQYYAQAKVLESKHLDASTKTAQPSGKGRKDSNE